MSVRPLRGELTNVYAVENKRRSAVTMPNDDDDGGDVDDIARLLFALLFRWNMIISFLICKCRRFHYKIKRCLFSARSTQ